MPIHPSPGVLDRSARRLRGAKPLQRRQGFHPLAPGANRREIWVKLLRFRREPEGVDHRQHVEIRQRELRPDQKVLPVRQLALHDPQAVSDLRHGMRDDLFVGCNAELREHVALVRDVIDQVRVVVAVDRADPLVHAAARLRIFRRQFVPVERLVDIGDDRGGLIHREIAVPQDRHPLERVQRDMARRVHFRFEVVEGVRHLLLRQDEPGNLDVGAAWKAKQSDFGHGLLHAAAGSGFRGGRVAFRHKPSARRTGEVQCLGECLGKAGRLR